MALRSVQPLRPADGEVESEGQQVGHGGKGGHGGARLIAHRDDGRRALPAEAAVASSSSPLASALSAFLSSPSFRSPSLCILSASLMVCPSQSRIHSGGSFSSSAARADSSTLMMPLSVALLSALSVLRRAGVCVMRLRRRAG